MFLILKHNRFFAKIVVTFLINLRTFEIKITDLQIHK
jgi:hypothetical protein